VIYVDHVHSRLVAFDITDSTSQLGLYYMSTCD